ncbi:hypothetical protein, partial [Paenibacillus lignilyticus]
PKRSWECENGTLSVSSNLLVTGGGSERLKMSLSPSKLLRKEAGSAKMELSAYQVTCLSQVVEVSVSK